jgi:hypothetical protein
VVRSGRESRRRPEFVERPEPNTSRRPAGNRNPHLTLTRKPFVNPAPPAAPWHGRCSLSPDHSHSRPGSAQTRPPMNNAASSTLFAYWDQLRAGRPAPDRAEIDPRAIAPVLGDTFILEAGRDGTLTYRLAGSRACALFARELKGSGFLDTFTGEARSALVRSLGDALAAPAGLMANLTATSIDRAHRRARGGHPAAGPSRPARRSPDRCRQRRRPSLLDRPGRTRPHRSRGRQAALAELAGRPDARRRSPGAAGSDRLFGAAGAASHSRRQCGLIRGSATLR